MVLTKEEGSQRIEKFILEISIKHRNIALKVTLRSLILVGFAVLPVVFRGLPGGLPREGHGLLQHPGADTGEWRHPSAIPVDQD